MIDIAQADVRDFCESGSTTWFSESTLYTNGQYETCHEACCEKRAYLAERDGAVWFRSATAAGEDKDKRPGAQVPGVPTYFATDVAYHYNKFLERKFDRVINVLGSRPPGAGPAFMKAPPSAALGISPERLGP